VWWVGIKVLGEYVRISVLKMEAVSFFEMLVLKRKVSDLLHTPVAASRHGPRA
jgi:hypothetical protein